MFCHIRFHRIPLLIVSLFFYLGCSSSDPPSVPEEKEPDTGVENVDVGPEEPPHDTGADAGTEPDATQPEEKCGLPEDPPCPGGSYCHTDKGECDAQGVCLPSLTEENCLEISAVMEACGCDGNTYEHPCFAAAAGISIDHDGPCEGPLTCQENEDCEEGLYCQHELGICSGDEGVCSPKPSLIACQPCDGNCHVCGCNGTTYPDACVAEHFGANLSHLGKCNESICFDNRECTGQGEDLRICLKAAGACSPFADGKCQPAPTDCPSEDAPVCGCDGQTYSNECQAHGAGITVDHEGECDGIAVECTENEDCEQFEYCAKPVAECDATGLCRRRPEDCPAVIEPVCGCDGQTYTNGCQAVRMGVSVAAMGACPPDPPECTTNEECGDQALYCRKPLGDCDGAGYCAERPSQCGEVLAPVCGCDGQTHDNPCEASRAGSSLAGNGPCDEVPVGCTTNTECARGEYCEMPIGECDGTGICQPRTLWCTPEENPVCGCDGTTYTNPCLASMVGVSLVHRGPCQEGPTECERSDQCERDQYCAKPDEECGVKGRCAQRPLECPRIYDPVCGCDGQSYDNPCLANVAGTTVAHRGLCLLPPQSCEHNGDCPRLEYCQKREGDCLGEGICTQRPIFCQPAIDFVCGCDGVTYNSPCEASVNGVNIQSQGECGGQGLRCRDTFDCRLLNQFCEKVEGACDALGVCQDRPLACDDIEDPVCGCNGITYKNLCQAKQAGQSILHGEGCGAIPGQCQENGECRGISEFCLKEAGMCDGQGQCWPRPNRCPPVMEPVCGCDGTTYTSECQAHVAGVSVSHWGECRPTTTECQSFIECNRSEFCSKRTGDCDGTGLCTTMPQNCPPYLEPVCGCDGNTYPNACEANRARVSVESDGPCPPPERECTLNTDCLRGEFCSRQAGQCDGKGYCRLRPQECDTITDPVCGCDGNTYANQCLAAQMGVNIGYWGTCQIVPEGCQTNLDCHRSQYCAKRDRDCEGLGECRAKPNTCLPVFEPVCGCDQTTYNSTCEAAMVGVNVLNRGECEPTGQQCEDNAGCPEEFYCQKGEGDCDESGLCMEMPTRCHPITDPVCGCDGNTYSNACIAASGGVNILHQGICEIIPGTCKTNQNCRIGDFCNKEDGDCDGQGRCSPIPEICLMEPNPSTVCGCDGITYHSRCLAHWHAVSIAYLGECHGSGVGCSTHLECNRSEYCKKELGECNEQGECESMPQECEPIRQPVCGCDRTTYQNACLAAMSRASLLHNGECRGITDPF